MVAMARSFAPRYDIHVVADDRLLLIGEDEVLRLDGEAYVAHALGREAAIPDHLLVETPDLPPGPAAWWDELGVDGAAATARLAAARVGVTSLDDDLAGLATALGTALAEDGVGVVPPDEAGLLVVPVDDYLDPRLAAIGRPFIPWRPRGRRLWFGPVLGAGRACWTCLGTRLAQNRPADFRLGGGRWLVPRPMADMPAVRRQAVAWAALELGRLLVRPPGGDWLLALDLADGRITRHPVSALSHCPVCGGKGVLPDGIPARLARQESALTGILAPPLVISPEPDLHLAFAAAQLGGPVGPAAAPPLIVAAAGKGRRPDDAILRARAEAVERHCGAWAGDRPIRRGRARDLAGAVLPPGVAEDDEIDWCEARSLLDGSARWLAAGSAWYGYSAGLPPAHSVGCAAGPTLEAAILAGLLELVERDALARWWHGMRAVPGVAEADGGWLLALPHQLNLPVIVALATDASGVVVLGAAADVDGPRAAERARLERGQIAVLMAAERHGLIVDPADPLHARLANWRADDDIADSPWLRPSGELRLTDLVAAGGLPACLERLRAARLDLVVLDQTRPEIGVPVVRVVVPGLMQPMPDDRRAFFL